MLDFDVLSNPRPPADRDDEPTLVGGEPVSGTNEPAALDDPSVLARPEEGSKSRYELGELLGEGGTARVYAAYDRDLGRDVAVKIVRRPDPLARDLFAQEARVTAALEHPNVAPIYDVGVAGEGLYLTMKRVTGRTLGEMLREAARAKRPEAMPVGELIEILLKLCDALAYAHARGVVHKDVKPDNVIIGEYGQVTLVDWGAAGSSIELDDPVIGTPTYMAPEQLLGAPEPRSDVYALGATLFHALLLRRPLIEHDRLRFWERKLAGALDLPSGEELSRVPRVLVAIALKAMSPRPEDRHESVAVFARALRDFVTGRTAWSAPLVVETFQDDSWRERWVAWPEGEVERQGNRLVTKNPRALLLVYRQRLASGVAVELEGQILPDGNPGDISVLFTDDDIVTKDGARWPDHGTTYGLQVGAYDNLRTGIWRNFADCLSGRPLRLEKGRLYRVRAEIDAQALRLFVDGELVADYEEMFPLPSGYVAIYLFFPGKAISAIRIFERGVAERVHANAVGDAFVARGDLEEAARQYRRVVELLGRTAAADEARYKLGLTLARTGDAAGCEATWRALRDPLLVGRARLHGAEGAFDQGDHAGVIAVLESTLEECPGLRGEVIHRWSSFVSRVLATRDLAALPYLALRKRAFSHDPTSVPMVAQALLRLGRFQELIDDCPDERFEAVQALWFLGRLDEALARYGDSQWGKNGTLLQMGRYDEIVPLSMQYSPALIRTGRAKEADGPEALLAQGRHAEVAAHAGGGINWATALRRLGRLDEAIASGDVRAMVQADIGEAIVDKPRDAWERGYVAQYLAISAFLRGDAASLLRLRVVEASLPLNLVVENFWVHRFVLLPLADELSGQAGALARALRAALEEHPTAFETLLARFARLVLGQDGDETFMAQPYRLGAPGRLHIAHAVRAEMACQFDEARAAYRRFLDLPHEARTFEWVHGDPLLELWARARTRGA